MNKLAMRTPDLAASNVENIAELFPHCVTEAHGERYSAALASPSTAPRPTPSKSSA